MWRRLLACALAAASGQTLAAEAVVPSDADGLACLVSGPSPATLSDHRDQLPTSIDPLTIRVRMRFSTPDGPPATDIVFVAPDVAPQTTVVYEGGPGLGQAAQAIADAYRLPCMPAGARPVEAIQTFVFRLDDFASVRLQDVDLRQFLGMVANVKSQKVLFDFRTMACPFDVHFTLRQPYLPNRVDGSAPAEPNRREFAEWLTTISSNLPPNTLKQLIGTGMKVSVPCTVLNLL